MTTLCPFLWSSCASAWTNSAFLDLIPNARSVSFSIAPAPTCHAPLSTPRSRFPRIDNGFVPANPFIICPLLFFSFFLSVFPFAVLLLASYFSSRAAVFAAVPCVCARKSLRGLARRARHKSSLPRRKWFTPEDGPPARELVTGVYDCLQSARQMARERVHLYELDECIDYKHGRNRPPRAVCCRG